MIYDELRNYLVQVSSPELVATFDRAIKLFDDYGIEDYMSSFDAIFGELTNGSTQDHIDALIHMLDSLIDALLAGHGVQLSEQADLKTELDALEAIYVVQHWEDKAGLSLILSSEVSSEELFAELVAYLLGLNAEQILLSVASVNKALINRIREEYACVDDEVESLEDVQQQVTDYARVAACNWACRVKFDKLVRYFGFLKQPFSFYLKAFLVDHSSSFLTQDTAEAVYRDWAQELVTLAAVSEEGLAKALPTIRAHMSEISSDLNVTTKLDTMVIKSIAEANSVKS